VSGQWKEVESRAHPFYVSIAAAFLNSFLWTSLRLPSIDRAVVGEVSGTFQEMLACIARAISKFVRKNHWTKIKLIADVTIRILQ